MQKKKKRERKREILERNASGLSLSTSATGQALLTRLVVQRLLVEEL